MTKPIAKKKAPKLKAKGGAGKRKGSAFERDVCVKLSLWVSGGKKTDLFWRSAMSGGRATVARKTGKMVRQAGDICATTPEGHSFTSVWFVECKSYKQIDLAQFLVLRKGVLAGWWKKCRFEARQYGREPMLIVKQNGWPALVVTKYDDEIEFFTTPIIEGADVMVTLFTDLVKEPFASVIAHGSSNLVAAGC